MPSWMWICVISFCLVWLWRCKVFENVADISIRISYQNLGVGFMSDKFTLATNEFIYAISNGIKDKMAAIYGLSNDKLSELISNNSSFTNCSNTTNGVGVFCGNINNPNYCSMDGLQVEMYSAVQEESLSNTAKTTRKITKNDIKDEELKKIWDELPQFVKDLYEIYLANLSEAERVEAEKGFLENLRDFFVVGFKTAPYAEFSVFTATPDVWENAVNNALTTSVEQKLKKDEANIKQIANLSLNFEQNIDEIKALLKDILGIEVTDDEVRANKDKLLQISELSKDFDKNISEITKIFKEMTGLDLLEEDLLKNKENIENLNKKSETLEKQYQTIKDKYKAITGKELSDEEFEKLLSGEEEVDNAEFQKLIQEYIQGYEEFVEIASDVVSGVASFAAFCGGTLAGGPFAGYAAAVATGAGIKYAMKSGNAKNKSGGYNTSAQDLISGGIGGLFNAIAPTVGSAATRAVFNRGGAKLLEKVTLKSANKSLPNYMNKAVSWDNKFLGASKTKHITARYMQAAVEGTTAITPYNIATELMADDEHKQGWSNVAVSTVVGGMIFGPIMDLGFRSMGKAFSKVSSEEKLLMEFVQQLQTGSPVSALAYKNITVTGENTFRVNIGSRTVDVEIPAKHLPADPAYIYTVACKSIGIETKEDILKTLGLKQIDLSSNKYTMKSQLLNLKDDEQVVISAFDKHNTYSVKVNDDGTVTLTSASSTGNNQNVTTKTMSMDEFVDQYDVKVFSREVMPEYVTTEKLNRMSAKSNILLSRDVTDNVSNELIVESIDEQAQKVVLKRVVTDSNGNMHITKKEMSYEEFIKCHNPQRTLDDVIQRVRYMAQKYGYDESVLREHYFKGLDINSPIFNDEASMLKYIKDVNHTAKIKNPNGDYSFSMKSVNSSTNAIETEFDTQLIIEITSLKHENPEFAKISETLLLALESGQINTKGLRNILKMLELGMVSDSTVDTLIRAQAFKDGNVNIYSLIGDTAPDNYVKEIRSKSLDRIKSIIGDKNFAKLKNALGDDIYNVCWNWTDDMTNDAVIKFVDDIQKIHAMKKAKIEPENFFINIEGYGKNIDWANSITQTANQASMKIKQGASLDDVLTTISKDTRQIDLARQADLRNQLRIAIKNGDTQKAEEIRIKLDEGVVHGSGILRSEHPATADNYAYTPVGFPGMHIKYGVYYDRFKPLLHAKNALHNPYPDIALTRIDERLGLIQLIHPKGKYAKAALKHVDDIYKQIQERFMGKEITEADLPVINEMIAEMHWILAHSMPWCRGSDAIANTFIKSVYNALGIKTYPQAKGVSLDLQAFCTELADYKKNYAKYYEKPPELKK